MPEEVPLIQIESMTRHYTMGENVVRALDGVDLRVRAGDFLVVVGSSGSGKSTLMHVVGLLDRPTSGSLRINGRDMSLCGDSQLSRLRNRHIGMVFQQFNLLNGLSVLDNVALPLAYSGLPPRERRARAVEYAELLGLGDRLAHLPTELSGGQMQRVAIARALANQPDILLADEPTGNLDSATSDDIMNVLYGLHAEGHTVIMVSHDPNVADQGTRKISLEDGRIIDDATGRRSLSVNAKLHRTSVEVNGAYRPGRSRLGFTDLLRIGVKEGLLTHKMRTFLTMLGIIIGVSSVIAMSSFSLGSKRKQVEQIRALGANLVRIVDNRLENERLSKARMGGSTGLARRDLEAIKGNVAEVEKAAAVREVKLNVLHRGRQLDPRVLGVSGDYLAVNNLELAEGRFFDGTDEHGCDKVLVIGHSVAKRLGGAATLGEVLTLGGTYYTVVGILADKHIQIEELEATSIADPNNDVLMPLNTLLSRTTFLDMRSEVDEIQLQLATEDDLYKAGRDIKRILAVTHSGVEDFDLVIPMDLLKQKQQAQRLLDVLTICISSISIIVGGIGIMNIMLASVTERIREIGIRRAIGAARRDILYQFLSESVLIAVTGGILGLAMAAAAVVAACAGLDIPVVFSPPLLVTAVVASTVTGLVFGLYPACQAANKNPVEALRYE